MLLDLACALSLVMLVLSELFAGTNPRLDERDLSAVGCRSWHHDRYAGQLVSDLLAAQADD